jgi:signal transduction histidine kinase
MVDETILPDAALLEALAEFAAGAGHEINNPLATISGRVQMLLKDEQDPARRQALLTIGGQALRIRDMIGDVMLFARPPQPQPASYNLVEVIQEVLAALSSEAQEQRCTFELAADPTVPIWADRTQLCVVLSSLLHNSLNALAEGGPISVTAHVVEDANRSAALFSVADNGPGLSEVERRQLFNPFYSGRQAGRGLGFGLPKCWRIVSNHGGRIEVDCGSNPSVCFRVFWPAPAGACGELVRRPT